MYVYSDIEERSCNSCCSEVLYVVSVYLWLWIQHGMRMRGIILPSVVCQAVQYFST